MTMVSAHELVETINCKVPGCTDEAKTNRGRHAYLCADHAHERGQETKAVYAANSARRTGGALTNAAAELVTKARAFERAYEQAVEMNQQAAERLVEFRQAITELRATCDEYVRNGGRL